jgi:hypothetical protein
MREKKSIITALGIILTALLPGLCLARTYNTTFPFTENPISESGNWINGQTDGIDWNDCRTTSGYVYGNGSVGAYKDPTALLTGGWGQDQTVEATVRTVNQNSSIYEEVEFRLRSTISPNVNSGYEINFRCLKTSAAYTEIVRWNGPLGDFTYLHRNTGASCGVADGDVVKATIIGNVITVYINGVQVNQATDNTFTSGSPGIGFYLQGGDTGVYNDYGFTSFTATDGLSDTETLIAHYEFENYANDSTINPLHGTPNNSPDLIDDCAVGDYSLELDSGLQSYIQIEDDNKLDITKEITIATWFKIPVKVIRCCYRELRRTLPSSYLAKLPWILDGINNIPIIQAQISLF